MAKQSSQDLYFLLKHLCEENDTKECKYLASNNFLKEEIKLDISVMAAKETFLIGRLLKNTRKQGVVRDKHPAFCCGSDKQTQQEAD